MKKIIYLSITMLMLPFALMAQHAEDDLYFVPQKQDKNKRVVKIDKKDKQVQSTKVYTSPGTTVIINHQDGNDKRDVDEYNRRYTRNTSKNDTIYIEETKDPDLRGEWVGGEFNGTQDDYEYAKRIIRFHNPRFAISISSPLYFDVVYGVNTWNWNVYTDGSYAYAFPTYTNPLWWNYRYDRFGWNWNYGWSRPYYSSWYDPYYSYYWRDPYWSRPYYTPYYYGGRDRRMLYTNRRSPRRDSYINYGTSRRSVNRNAYRTSSDKTRNYSNRTTSRRTYTRPSSTRKTGSSHRNNYYNGNVNRTNRSYGSSRRTSTSTQNKSYTPRRSNTTNKRSYNSTPQRTRRTSSSYNSSRRTSSSSNRTSSSSVRGTSRRR